MGRKTVELHHISKRYGEKVLIDDFDYIVLKNQRLGIIGPNGCGKSTLIKIIAGLIEPDSGSVEIGETIQLGYFAQEVPDMDTNQRPITIGSSHVLSPACSGMCDKSKTCKMLV